LYETYKNNNRMIITFIGNCQTVSLCFFFQQLLPTIDIGWVLYGIEFQQHLVAYSNKCKNKILDYSKSIERVKISDIIIYQEISEEKSLFCNSAKLEELKKSSCRLVKIPSIHLDYSKYDTSIKELQTREIEKKVDVPVSTIFEKHKEKTLMITKWHPNTFLFLELMKEICLLLEIDFFSEEQTNEFLKKNNYMELP
jgi:hypothetical protein